MSLTLSLGGVDKTAFWYFPSEEGQVSASLMAGSRGPLRLVVYDLDGASGFRPTEGETIAVTDGVVTLAGIVDNVDEEGLTDLDTGVKSTITASDLHSYADRVYITGSYNAGTSLRDVVTDILAVSGLDDFGVTLDAGAMGGTFPNGPLMVATTTVDGTVTEAFNKLQTLTGFIWRIDAAAVLKWREPAWEDCGYSLGDASGGVLGRVTVTQARRTNYTNRVRLTCGPTGAGDVIVNSWTGDGVTSVFALKDLNVHASNVWPGVVNIGGTVIGGVITGGVNWPLYGPGLGGANDIEWDYTINDGTLTFHGTSVPGVGVAINLQYVPLYPFVVQREDATDVLMPPTGHGPYLSRETATEITKYAEAVATADAMLRVGMAGGSRVIKVRTDKGPAYPGQKIALSFAERAVNTTCLITAVDVSNRVDGTLEYSLTCVDGTELGETWLDFFKGNNFASAGGGGTVVVSSGGSGSAAVVTAPIYLGGSRTESQSPSPAAWSQVPHYLPYDATQSTTLRLRAFIAARSGTVTVRLYDETAAAAVSGSVSAATTSAWPAFSEFTATVAVASGHRYRLEILNSVADAPVFGIGQLEGI